MKVFIHKKEGRFWFDRDAPRPLYPCVTHGVEVPDGSEWIDLIDCTRPEVKLHALRMRAPRGEDIRPIEIDFNADYLMEIAMAGRWLQLARLVTTERS